MDIAVSDNDGIRYLKPYTRDNPPADVDVEWVNDDASNLTIIGTHTVASPERPPDASSTTT